MNLLQKLLQDTWNFFRRNLGGIWHVIWPVVIPLSILGAITMVLPEMEWPSIFLDILMYPIIQAATIFYISSIITGDKFSRTVCYRYAHQFWPPLVILYLATSLSIFVGLIFLIIPGLIIAARLAFAEFFCLLHKQKSMEAYNSSWAYTYEYQWIILGGLLIIGFLAYLPVWFIDQFMGRSGMFGLLFLFFTNVIYYVSTVFLTIFCFRVFTFYFDNKDKKNIHSPL